MRVLCICSHGNVRSVALAYLIKTIYKHEAIAIGINKTSSETQEMLYKWADRIILLDKDLYEDDLPLKTILLDVGPDVWHNPFAQELQHKLLRELYRLDL